MILAEQQVVVHICRCMLLKEVLMKMSRISHQVRSFIQTRINLIREERHFTVNMTLPKPLPRRKMWIPTCFNSITIEIFEKVNLSYFVKVMKNFSPKVSLDLKLQKF